MPIGDMLDSHVVTVKKLNNTISGTQYISSYTNRSTGNVARIVPSGGSLSPQIMGRFPQATNLLYVLSSVTILAGDRVVDEATGGDTFNVLSVNEFFEHGAVSDHKECVLERLEVVG